MSRIKGKNTKPELALFELVKPLWHVCRYRKHCRNLPGKPDLVFPRAKLVVFVDGAFWHGKDYAVKSAKWQPKWKEKIEGNMRRDGEVNEQLKLAGYSVLRFWDNEVLQNDLRVINEIENLLILRLQNDQSDEP